MTTTETVMIDGITYNVDASYTAERLEAEGKPNTARHMREHRMNRHLYLLRPKSRGVRYFAVEYVRHGRTGYGPVVSMGR